MSGSSGVPARRSRYADPDDFVGPLRPGEEAPRVSVANQMLSDWRMREKKGPARVYATVIEPVVGAAKSAASAASRTVKKGAVWLVLGAVGFLFIAFFLRQLAGRLVRG